MSTLHTAGLHHITLVARNARRTLAFYRDVLGLSLVKQTVNFDDPGAYHLYFGDPTGAPGTLVTFFEWADAPQGRFGIGGVHHVAFGTASRETLLMWKRWLSDHGIPVTGPLDRGWFTSLYFRDPDGQVLEIATMGPGYTVDEPFETLGTTLIMPAAKQLAGTRDEHTLFAANHPEPLAAITPEMALTGMHHVTGMTDDLPRMGEFFEQALGMRLVKQSVNQDDPDTLHYFWAATDETGVRPRSSYTLFGWPRTAPRARGGVGQTHHVAFRVRDAEAQAAWRDHLLSIGLDVSPVMDRTYFSSLYFHAPDGLLVELATDPPGFAIDEAPDALGTTLKLPEWLEPQREEIARQLAPLG
ncbi:MAG: VOC family protein [Gemmatimonadaceae bacterium]|jgi:glyoxalase family protein|nr:VOC family protein [Gemmatimonadaceae bacterium]